MSGPEGVCAKIRETAYRHSGGRPLKTLDGIAHGLRYADMEKSFGYSRETLRKDISTLLIELGLGNTYELISTACIGGLITPVLPPENFPEALCLRQREILELRSLGCTVEQVASELKLSLDTAKSHVRRTMIALGVDSYYQAVALYRQRMNSHPGKLRIDCRNCLRHIVLPVKNIRTRLTDAQWSRVAHDHFRCRVCTAVHHYRSGAALSVPASYLGISPKDVEGYMHRKGVARKRSYRPKLSNPRVREWLVQQNSKGFQPAELTRMLRGVWNIDTTRQAVHKQLSNIAAGAEEEEEVASASA